MQLTSDFTQTEVGSIPSDWAVVPITEITREIFLGLTSKVDYVEHGGVPLIRATDIAGGKLSFAKARTISRRQHKKLTKYRQAGRDDVLVSKSGSLGVCAIVDVDREFSIYESIIVLQPKRSLSPEFLLCLLRDEGTQSRMVGEKVGSSVSHLNLEMFRNLVVPLPPPAEQRAIAEALSDVDALINALDALITKKRHIKQGTMQQLLTGKKRLPGFSGEWVETTLEEIAIVATGSTPPTRDASNYGDKFLFVSPADLGTQKLICRTEKGLSEKGFSVARRFPPQSVLFTCIGSTIGKVGVAATELTSNQQINAIFPAESNSSDFLYYALCLTAPIIRQLASEHAVPMINKSEFQKTLIRFPPLEEQNAIAAVLSDMDAEITALEQKRDKTKLIKQGMMQELLTGKTRLV